MSLLKLTHFFILLFILIHLSDRLHPQKFKKKRMFKQLSSRTLVISKISPRARASQLLLGTRHQRSSYVICKFGKIAKHQQLPHQNKLKQIKTEDCQMLHFVDMIRNLMVPI
jgi:hypothetical protein